MYDFRFYQACMGQTQLVGQLGTPPYKHLSECRSQNRKMYYFVPLLFQFIHMRVELWANHMG
jgi:hypothetical protein